MTEPGTTPPTQDAVELPHARTVPGFADDFDVGDRRGHGHSCFGHALAAFWGSRQSLFLECVPASTIGATPEPPERLMAAGLAMKCRFRLHPYSLHIINTYLKAS
jgi:hypothetical protein